MSFRVLRHDIPVPGLDPAHDGLVIAHVTDVHVGMLTPRRFVERALAAANAAKPDLTFLTGDYVCYGKKFVPVMGEALRGLEAKEGVLATLGNHDYWTDAEGCARVLRANGYDVMRNASTELVIKADQRLKYGDVKEVMRMTKEAGFQDVGLITDKRTTGTAKPAAS